MLGLVAQIGTHDERDVLQRRSLASACLAHFLHDGYTDQLYALLPIWQPEFGLSYAGLAVLRALYSGTMGGLQLPMERIAARLTPRAALTLATFVAAGGYLLMALPLGFAGLCAGLVVAGVGSSLQHPRASVLVAYAYGAGARRPLGVYNFAGDLGKAVFPSLVALLLPIFAWRPLVAATSVVGMAVGFALLALVPAQSVEVGPHGGAQAEGGDGRGFGLLFTISAFDTAARMGYLLFLPFLIRAKGGEEAVIGIALALLFIGGAFGKASCGWLGERLGVIWSVTVTEAATALLILATLFAPLGVTMILLPFLGIVLNGTSSVLYGTVPELAKKGEFGRAFALLYTAVSGAGGLAPIAYGALADHSSSSVGVIAAASTALATIPLAIALRAHLRDERRRPSKRIER